MSQSRLTGPPRIGHLELPHCSAAQPVDLSVDAAASVYVRTQGGLRRIRERAVERVVLGWEDLDYELVADLMVELRQPVVPVTPRTRAAGDPDIEEDTVAMRLVTPLRLVDALWREGLVVRIELEALDYLPEPPPLVAPTIVDTALDPPAPTAGVVRVRVTVAGSQPIAASAVSVTEEGTLEMEVTLATEIDPAGRHVTVIEWEAEVAEYHINAEWTNVAGTVHLTDFRVPVAEPDEPPPPEGSYYEVIDHNTHYELVAQGDAQVIDRDTHYELAGHEAGAVIDHKTHYELIEPDIEG